MYYHKSYKVELFLTVNLIFSAHTRRYIFLNLYPKPRLHDAKAFGRSETHPTSLLLWVTLDTQPKTRRGIAYATPV